MKRIVIAGVLSLFSSLLYSAQANPADFLEYFANPNFGPDPGEPDTVYLDCVHQTSTTQTIQFRFKTDNSGSGDSIIAILIPLFITADKPGVTLDTTRLTTYAGTAVQDWDILAVSVSTTLLPPYDPSVFPMKLIIGGIDNYRQHLLASGDFLIANLTFQISEPTTICIDTTSDVAALIPIQVATTLAVDYSPQWRKLCCGPVVPTLSQYGLLIFGVLLFGLMVYAIKKAKRVLT